MKEIITSEFSLAQYQLTEWIIHIILGSIFIISPLLIILAYIFTDSTYRKKIFKNIGILAACILSVITTFFIGSYLLYWVRLEILDYATQRVEVLDINIMKAQRIKNHNQILIQNNDGTLSPILIDFRWQLDKLPAHATLWRAKYSKMTLKLFLHSSQKTFNVNDPQTNSLK